MSQPLTLKPRGRYHLDAVAACSYSTLVAGALVLIGWRFDILAFKSVVPGFISMKANTAVGLMFLAAATLLNRREEILSRRRELVASFFAASAFLIGSLTLSEYLFGWEAHIDELLFKDPAGISGRFPPGRLAPITALLFMLLGGACLLTYNRTRQFYRTGQFLVLLTLLVAFQAAIGYLFGVHYSFGRAYYTQMAVHTALLLVLICIAILASRPQKGWMAIFNAPTEGGRSARTLMASALVVPPVVNWLQLQGQRAGLYDADFGVVLQTLGNTVFFITIVLRNAIALHAGELIRSAGEAQRTLLLAQQKASEAIELSEARLRAIFDAAFDAIVGMDSDGNLVDWNPRAETIFGWKKDEVIGKKMSEIIIPEKYRAAHEHGMQRFKSTGTGSVINTTIEIEALRQNGEVFPIQLSITPIRTGETYLFTAFIADITERKLNEQELISAKQAALDAAQAKSNFLANMSHEIRTPLNGIIGMTDLVLETSLNDQQRRHLQIVQDSGTGLLTIINDILDFSKIDADKLELELVDFDLAAVVEGQAELLAGRAEEKGLSVMTFIDPLIPKLLKGDPGRIAQILLNLLGNAIKFTHTGHVVVRADALTHSDDKFSIRFSVADTGIGLSKEAATKLFRPFIQADGSTARKYGGTGLGLSISKRLVELMGGEIGIESEPGKGARFWFELALGFETSKRYGSSGAPIEMAGLRVLLVDDDLAARTIYRSYLEAWQIEVQDVTHAKTAMQALLDAEAEGRPFDLALLDRCMPEEDGASLAATIRQNEKLRKTPLLMITAFSRGISEPLPADSPFSDVLIKPIKQSELFDSIANAVRPKSGDVQLPQSPSPPSTEMTQSKLAANSQRILVAEDNAVNQLLTLTQLKKLGYHAQAVANGREAVEAVLTGTYDLVLMDCQMPEMDGLEATIKIRELEIGKKTRLTIIALTANAMKEDQDRCLRAGMDDYISKPVKKEILAKMLAKWLPENRKASEVL